MLEHLTTAATVIGYFVMVSWVILLVWLIAITVGEFQFNHRLKKQAARDWDNTRSTWIFEDRLRKSADETPRYDTAEQPHFHFLPDEDSTPTVETAAVFDIRERYPDEFTRDHQAFDQADR